MTELAIITADPPNPLTGPPAAREIPGLLALMRGAGVSAAGLEATQGWLAAESRTSERTQDGYVTDLSRWVVWCWLRGTLPTGAVATDADNFTKDMREAGLANATRARRLAAVSSWYRYLMRHQVAGFNPFDAMARPKPPEKSETRGLCEDELEKLLAWASERDTPRNFAVLALMAATACRVCSITGAQVDALGEDKGHQVIDLPVKGTKTKRFVLPAFTLEAIGRWLDARPPVPGPLFLGTRGGPLGQPAVYRLVQKAAAGAGIKNASRLSPHGIRHTVLTILHSRNYPTHIIQDLAGHADTRTTRSYDLLREALERSPANDLGTIFAAGVSRWAPSFRKAA